MKKVIKGSVYNTETAKLICTKKSEEVSHSAGAVMKIKRHLYKTKSNKYFYHQEEVFETWIAVNDDDIEPEMKYTEVQKYKIIPIQYNVAVNFASELIAESDEFKESILKYFPELDEQNIPDGETKVQKKIYLTSKAEWYLEMMLKESEDTNSSFIEKLIVNKYAELYRKGIMNDDPFFEFNEQ